MTKSRRPRVDEGSTALVLSNQRVQIDNGASSNGSRRPVAISAPPDPQAAGPERRSPTRSELQQTLRAVERERDAAARERDEQSTLLDSTAHGIVSLDLDGCCTYINRAGADMLGYEPNEVVGQSIHELCHSRRPDGSPYPAEECPRWVASQSGEAVIAAEEVFWRRDGTSFPVQFTSSSIYDDGASPAWLLASPISVNAAELTRLGRPARRAIK